MALIALGFYLVRLQVFNELQSVGLELNDQAQRIQSMRTNIQTIADFLNQQAQALRTDINTIYTVVLIGLLVFVIRVQLFGQVASVQESLEEQSSTMDELQSDISAIVGAINRQIQAGQQQNTAPATEPFEDE